MLNDGFNFYFHFAGAGEFDILFNWKPPAIENRPLQKVFNYMQNNAEDIKPLIEHTWYHVVDLKNRKCWGFKVNQHNVVIDSAVPYLIGRNYSENTNPNLIVAEIGKILL